LTSDVPKLTSEPPNAINFQPVKFSIDLLQRMGACLQSVSLMNEVRACGFRSTGNSTAQSVHFERFNAARFAVPDRPNTAGRETELASNGWQNFLEAEARRLISDKRGQMPARFTQHYG
jgi:hypothetical protein